MFEHASVMVLMQDEEGLKVRKIETDRETQEQMCQNCANAYKLSLIHISEPTRP